MSKLRLLLDWITDQFLFPLWQALFAPAEEAVSTETPARRLSSRDAPGDDDGAETPDDEPPRG